VQPSIEKEPPVNPRASDGTGLNQARGAAVMAEQIDLLYRSGAALLINPLAALIVAALLWRIYPAWIVLGWLALVVAVFIARHMLGRQFQRRKGAAQDAERWGRYFAFGAAATGCHWGLLGSVVFMTDNATFYVLAAFVLGGMAAGAALRDSVYPPAFYGFVGPAVAPMVAALLAKGSLVSGGTGLLLTTFVAVIALAARDNNRRAIENIRMRRERADLTDDLQCAARALTKEIADRESVTAALEESSERFRAIGEQFVTTASWLLRSIPSWPETDAFTRCWSSRREVVDGWTLQMGQHQAPQGQAGRRARQAVRQTRQVDRGVRSRGWGSHRVQPVIGHSGREGEGGLDAQRQHRPGHQARHRRGRGRCLRRVLLRGLWPGRRGSICAGLDGQSEPSRIRRPFGLHASQRKPRGARIGGIPVRAKRTHPGFG
jgi:hypothetical protein